MEVSFFHVEVTTISRDRTRWIQGCLNVRERLGISVTVDNNLIIEVEPCVDEARVLYNHIPFWRFSQWGQYHVQGFTQIFGGSVKARYNLFMWGRSIKIWNSIYQRFKLQYLEHIVLTELPCKGRTF